MPHPVTQRPGSIAVLAALSLLAALIASKPAGATEAVGHGGAPGSIIGREDPVYERGSHLLRIGEIDAAVAELARAVEIAPDNPKVLARYAQALIVSGDAKASTQALERLRELDPSAPGLNYFLGLASYQGGDWSTARDHLRIAIADDPDNALSHLFLGVAYHELGEYEEASQALDVALRLDPSLSGQIAYRRGLLHFAQSRFAEAKVEFESVAARQTGSPLARSAASYVERLERLRPRPWEVYASVGGGYDSNLNFSNDSDPTVTSGLSGGRLLAEVGASYLFGNDRRSLTVGQTLYGAFYPDESTLGPSGVVPADFNQQISRTWAQAQAEILGPVSVDARYSFENVWTDWRQFRRTNALEPGLSFSIGQKLVTRAFFRWERRDFLFPVSDPDFDRDGEIMRAGGDATFSLPAGWFGKNSFARVGYRMRREDAVGKEYDAYGHEPVITLSLSLPEKVLLTLDGRVEWRNYENASSVDLSAGLREDVIGQLRANLQRPFGEHFTVELSYGYVDRSSNVATFEYARHELSVLTTYRY